MFYLGIDQHKRQLTVNLRGEDGFAILIRRAASSIIPHVLLAA